MNSKDATFSNDHIPLPCENQSMHHDRTPSDAVYPAIIVLFTSSAGTVRPAIRSEHPGSSPAASSCEDMSAIERRGGMATPNGMPPLRTIWEKNMLTAFGTDMPSCDLIFICKTSATIRKKTWKKTATGVPAQKMRIVFAAGDVTPRSHCSLRLSYFPFFTYLLLGI